MDRLVIVQKDIVTAAAEVGNDVLDDIFISAEANACKNCVIKLIQDLQLATSDSIRTENIQVFVASNRIEREVLLLPISKIIRAIERCSGIRRQGASNRDTCADSWINCSHERSR